MCRSKRRGWTLMVLIVIGILSSSMLLSSGGIVSGAHAVNSFSADKNVKITELLGE